MNKKIPTLLVHGSLGSGKTTLIKRLLSVGFFAGSFIIENEFASENIDKQTLESHQDDWSVFDIAGGCICCSSGAELEEALKFVVDKGWRKPVIIETTGVASSAQLIQKLFLNPVFLEHFELIKNIYVLDPLEVDPVYLEKEKELDIKLADLVVINKTDLAENDRVEAIEKIVAKISLNKAISCRAIHAEVDPALIDVTSGSRIEEAIAENFSDLQAFGISDHGATYAVFDIPNRMNKGDAERLLVAVKLVPGVTMKRAKGYFSDPQGDWWHLEATRQHQAINPTEPKKKGVLVFIGDGINKEVIGRALSEIQTNA